jgi:hypothetical protein
MPQKSEIPLDRIKTKNESFITLMSTWPLKVPHTKSVKIAE